LGRLAVALPVGLVSLALGACSPVTLLNSLVSDEGYRVESNLAYGDGPRRTLDVYVPDRLNGPAPIVVFFYGGSWQNGAKDDYRFAAEGLVSRGYVVMVPDYRLWPEVAFPGFVEDGAAAVSWAFANGESYGGNVGQVYVMGHSAGAHIAALLALDGRYLAAVGRDRSQLAGLIGLAGPYDFLPVKSKNLKQIFHIGVMDPAPSQPINFAGGGAPPSLLVTGDDDSIVYPKNSINLARRLGEAGDRVTLKRYPGLGHIGIVLALARPLPFRAAILDDVDAFVQANGAPARQQP
jgi:acetyl esterase/lipase